MQEMWIQYLDREDPLEKEMATYSSILAWEIPWTEESGRLRSIRSQKSWHDLETKQQQSVKEKEGRIWGFQSANLSAV